MIDIDIRQELQYELIDDEKLIWTGRPGLGIIFRKIDIFLIPFSVFWFGMMLFIIFGAATSASQNSDVPWPIFLFFYSIFSGRTLRYFWKVFDRQVSQGKYDLWNNR